MLKHNIRHIFISVCILLMMPVADLFAKESNNDVIAIEGSVNVGKVYDGQSFTLIYTLYSKTTDINHVYLKSSIELGERLHKLSIPSDNLSVRWKKDKYKNRECYSAVIMEAPVLAVKSGAVSISPVSFDIGLISTRVVNDFFWGPVEQKDVENIVVEAESFKFNILPIPKPKNGFSGAVGDFSIEAILPAGDIVEGQEMFAVYRIKGTGSLESAILPDLKKYIPEGLKLISESTSDSSFLRNGEIQYILDVEVTLDAQKKGNYEIPPVEMDCFNPKTGKYQTIKSNSLKIVVGEDKAARRTPSKVYQI